LIDFRAGIIFFSAILFTPKLRVFAEEISKIIFLGNWTYIYEILVPFSFYAFFSRVFILTPTNMLVDDLLNMLSEYAVLFGIFVVG